MTTSAFETVRTIPLIVEKDVCPMSVDGEDTGFPFDSDFDREGRDEHWRSQLDDIATRHPEFAEHLEGFPFRSDSLGRRTRPPRPSEESEFRRFGRPFGSSRFERFGFPFTRSSFEEDHQKAEDAKSEPPSQEQPQQKQTKEEEAGAPARSRRQNIQQSNTVDLGQKQEPVNDSRNQRSMSAPPPDNRKGQQRFVSSINIPINRDGSMGDMGTQQSQPQQQEKSANKPTERVIPIHVEGRDEPVMPKHQGPSFSQPQPQPERIFGHRPSQFTQYVGRESPRPFGGPEWHHQAYTRPEPVPTDAMKQQQQQYQQAQQQKFQQQQQQVPPQKPQQQVPPEKPQEQVPPPQQQQQPKPTTPIDIIQSIQKDVSELMGQVEKFNGVPRDKQYLYLDEMLTRNLIKLDNIDTQGQENIRQARKEAIKCIESCIAILEAKAAANVPKEEEKTVVPETEMETKAENKPEDSQEKMEVEVKEQQIENQSDNKAEEKTVTQPPTEEKMEVVNEAAVTNEPPKETPSEENSQQEKTDQEMKEENKEAQQTTTEASQEEEDNKEKKKGKKKDAKK